MSPPLTFYNSQNCYRANVELFGKHRSGYFVKLVASADFAHTIIAQFSLRMALAKSIAFLFAHVGTIVGIGPKKQMRLAAFGVFEVLAAWCVTFGANAWRVIAAMKDSQVFRYGAVMQFVRESVCELLSSCTYRHDSVSARKTRTFPKPAALSLFHLAPELSRWPLLQRGVIASAIAKWFRPMTFAVSPIDYFFLYLKRRAAFFTDERNGSNSAYALSAAVITLLTTKATSAHGAASRHAEGFAADGAVKTYGFSGRIALHVEAFCTGFGVSRGRASQALRPHFIGLHYNTYA